MKEGRNWVPLLIWVINTEGVSKVASVEMQRTGTNLLKI